MNLMPLNDDKIHRQINKIVFCALKRCEFHRFFCVVPIVIVLREEKKFVIKLAHSLKPFCRYEVAFAKKNLVM